MLLKRYGLTLALLWALASLVGCGGGSNTGSSGSAGGSSGNTGSTSNPVPALTSLSPSGATSGSPAVSLSVLGTSFVSGATLRWNGNALATTFSSSTQLQAQVPASDLMTAGSANITVVNPSPGGGTSNPLSFNVTAVGSSPNPAPTLTSLSPSSCAAGGMAFILTLTGTNFISSSQVLWNGTPRSTAYGSQTSLAAQIDSADIATGGTASVTVSNPAPGGGTSSAITFTINASQTPNQGPTLTSITPSFATVGSSPIMIALKGTNFVSNSVVNVSGTAIETTFQSATSLQAIIPATSLAAPGTLPISVTNPSPGGGVSNIVNFTVTSSSSSTANVQTIDVLANDIVWDQQHSTFYLSIPSAAGANGNSITPLDPYTGALGKSVYAGSEPKYLAISSDDSLLYTELTGSDTIQRFTLPSLTPDINFAVGGTSSWGPDIPIDLAVAPGEPHSLAVLRGDPVFEDGGAVIFDDATPRTKTQKNSSYGYSALRSSIVWGKDATRLYLAGQVFIYLSSLSIGADGVDSEADFQESPYNGAGGGIHFDSGTGYLYDNHGHVTDPNTGLPIGVFDASGVMVPDSSLGVAFFVGQSQTNIFSGTYTLEAFDITHFTPLGTVTLNKISGTPVRLIRWGSSGLALLTSVNVSYPNQGGGQVYLISGPFVNPQGTSALARSFEAGVAPPRRTWSLDGDVENVKAKRIQTQ